MTETKTPSTSAISFKTASKTEEVEINSQSFSVDFASDVFIESASFLKNEISEIYEKSDIPAVKKKYAELLNKMLNDEKAVKKMELTKLDDYESVLFFLLSTYTQKKQEKLSKYSPNRAQRSGAPTGNSRTMR